MNYDIRKMQNELDQTLHLLDRKALFSITEEEGRELARRGKALSDKLDTVEDSYVTVGLIGGTGVGKSTLMNALAGSEIASESHRRPHTDRVLIYRHRSAATDLPETGIPSMEITHRVDSIRSVVLCDLPDYDSLLGKHLEIVIGFLDRLDILVWVTSPEKYADAQFYEFLKRVPKAKENFYFVLNKTDLFFSGQDSHAGYENLERVMLSLDGHMRKSGIEAPVLYVLSAREARVPGADKPWNQFHAFRRQIFQQRDAKRVAFIKTANLDVEVRRFQGAFEKERKNLETFEHLIDRTIEEIQMEDIDGIQAGRQEPDSRFVKQLREDIIAGRTNPSALLGLGYGIALFFERHSRGSAGKGNPADTDVYDRLSHEMADSFLTKLTFVEERLIRRTLQQNLPAAFADKIKQVLGIEALAEGLKEDLTSALRYVVQNAAVKPFWGIKSYQILTYAIFVLFFFLALGDRAAWQNMLNAFSVFNTLQLVLSMVQNLFSPKGLAALGSFSILYVLAALYFYRRYRTRLQRDAKKLIVSLTRTLAQVRREKSDELLDELKRFKDDIHSLAMALQGSETIEAINTC